MECVPPLQKKKILTFVAEALEASRHVPAPSVPADPVVLGALVDVQAVPPAVVLPEEEPGVSGRGDEGATTLYTV